MAQTALLSFEDDTVDLADALRALAFMGDLSMGQPVDHSTRVAMLACKLARCLGLDDALCRDVMQVALLRWSGCTANAVEVAQTVSDDVQGRAAMLALQVERVQILVAAELLPDRVAAISAIHCEVSGIVAQLLALPSIVAISLNCVFEHWDGSGRPHARRGDEIPLPAQIVAVASELEIFSRVFGLDRSLGMLRERAGSIHANGLVSIATTNAPDWLGAINQGETVADQIAPSDLGLSASQTAPLALLADVIDLKLPWLTGYSREVARLADLTAAQLGLAGPLQARVRRAGLLHGLGRVAIPNAVWDRPGQLSAADWESARLSPYWTSRAAQEIQHLALEVQIASHTYERLDGTGYFRAARQTTTPLDHRILPVVTALVAMQARRPWRPALSRIEAFALLRDQARIGRFDASTVAAAEAALVQRAERAPGAPAASSSLSRRELDVLRRVGLGDSNKEAAVHLGISPATVRTHMESVFRKLACNSRSAATLRASMLGLL
jgi:HD-GYP domain-containing protein (c-di-GMP phosphodiesterase class II)